MQFKTIIYAFCLALEGDWKNNEMFHLITKPAKQQDGNVFGYFVGKQRHFLKFNRFVSTLCISACVTKNYEIGNNMNVCTHERTITTTSLRAILILISHLIL